MNRDWIARWKATASAADEAIELFVSGLLILAVALWIVSLYAPSY